MDLSQYSDAELEAMLGQSGQPDLSGYSDADLEVMLGEQSPPVEVQKSNGFLLDVQNAYTNRTDEMQKAADRYASGEQSMPETVAQQAMQYGSLFPDTLGAGLSAVTPDFIGEPLSQVVGYGVNKISNLPMGEGVGRTVGDATSQFWGNLNDAQKADVTAAGQALGLFSMTKAGDFGKTIEKSGLNSLEKSKGKLAKNLVSAGATDEARLGGRVETGFWGDKITPSQQEIEMAAQVQKVPDFSPRKTIQNNLNAVKRDVWTKGGDLLNRLKSAETYNVDEFGNTYISSSKVPRQKFTETLDNVLSDLQSDDSLVTDTIDKVTGNYKLKGSARTIVKQYQKIIDKHPLTPAGLLEARREFDKEMLSRGTKVFDAKTVNIRSAVTNKLRSMTNNIIEEYAPFEGVKSSLKEQSLLFNAAEQMLQKAKGQSPIAIVRQMDKLPIKNNVKGAVLGAAALGGGALATTAAPYTVLGGLGTYGTYKAITAPVTRQVLGKGVSALETVRAPQAAIMNQSSLTERAQRLIDRRKQEQK